MIVNLDVVDVYIS